MGAVSTYPYGYADPPKRVTVADLDGKLTWSRLHGEMRRRLLAMFDAAQNEGHDLGLGGGWRSSSLQLATALARHVEVASGGCCIYEGKRYQLRPKTAHAAFPDGSYHESTTDAGEALAADLIGDLVWMNANCWRFGLIHFAQVNSEPWHVQPTEMPRSRRKYTGQALAVWPLPAAPPPIEITPPIITEAKMLIIVGNEDNHDDPRRWVWDGGTSLRYLNNEAEYTRLLDLARAGVCQFHPVFSTLAAPFWMPTAERSQYGQH